MKGVRRTTLGACCDIVSGATPSTSYGLYWDGGIEWATPRDLSDLDGKYIARTARRITEQGLVSCAATLLPPNSVLFSSRAPIGHVAINLVPMATNQGFKSFVPRQDEVDPGFLYYWLRANRPYLESLGNGATFKEVSKAVVSRIEIDLPPLSEQRRIADILDKTDAIRRKRKEAIALTEELLRSAFLEMFGDPVTNPKGWPVRPLADMALQISDGTHKTPSYIDAGVPFLSAKNVRAHRIDWVRAKFIAKEEHRELIRRCRPERGDVLLTKSGTIGEAAVVDRDTEFSLFESVALLKLKRDVLSPALVAALLNNPSVRRLYGADVKGVGVKHLHLVDLRKLPTICPPRPIQERYERFESSIKTSLIRAERGSADADSLFNSLVNRAFASAQ